MVLMKMLKILNDCKRLCNILKAVSMYDKKTDLNTNNLTEQLNRVIFKKYFKIILLPITLVFIF